MQISNHNSECTTAISFDRSSSSNMARCASSNGSSIALKLELKHQQSIQNALSDVECRIYEWLYGPKYTHKWKYCKRSRNEHLNINCDSNDALKNITIHSLDDKSHKKCKLWKAVAYLPCVSPREAIQYYTVPHHHLEWDDMNTIHKLQQFTLQMPPDCESEYDINVAVTNPKLNGLISPRLSANIGVSKWSDKMNAYGCFGRFMKPTMMRQLKQQLHITKADMKHTISKNLNLYWGAKPITIDTENGQRISLTEMTYVLQINNGGWIPQWAVEMGLIDQHMILIFAQITKWMSNRPVTPPQCVPSSEDEPTEESESSEDAKRNAHANDMLMQKDESCDSNESEIKNGDWVNISLALSVTTESGTWENICNGMDELAMEVISMHECDALDDDPVYVEDKETNGSVADERNDCCIM
eukprot:1144449_1